MAKNRTITIADINVRVTEGLNDDFICITDMIKAKEGSFFISDWLRNRNTLEFMAAWEQMHNPNFNYGEFATIASSSGLNSYKISVKDWIKKTGAIGLISKTGRYGGTYAQKDIALEFGTWISPQFKLYLIKEYQRLKEVESNSLNIEWSIKRVLGKVNYQLHTDAIKEHIIPSISIAKDREWLVYAQEADILNVVIFGFTAKEWRDTNPKLHLEGKNIRDIASINELTVLSNIENLNAVLLRQGVLSKKERFKQLSEIAKEQLKALEKMNFIKSLKYTSNSTYPLALAEEKSKE